MTRILLDYLFTKLVNRIILLSNWFHEIFFREEKTFLQTVCVTLVTKISDLLPIDRRPFTCEWTVNAFIFFPSLMYLFQIEILLLFFRKTWISDFSVICLQFLTRRKKFPQNTKLATFHLHTENCMRHQRLPTAMQAIIW